jgi:Fe-S-cluster-containing dehydrogenase component
VCPTDAIQYSDRERRVVVTDACIGCNLCVLRCPVGAIFVEKTGKANTLAFNADGYRDAHVTETSTLLKLPAKVAVSRAEEVSAIRKSIAMQHATDKADFYPLTGSLLTSIGLYTVVSRAGDTNNRMDAVVVDKTESMPAEIKSPSEVEYINVKAVRQAVENKVVMTARKMFPTTKDTSTLAIGYSYANDRSDVEELVEDIAKTFGINVGLVSIEVLYILVWNRYIKGEETAALAFRKLRGRAHAAIS